MRRLDSPDPRRLRRVAGLEVVDVGVLGDRRRARDKLGDDAAQMRERLRPEHVPHHDHAIAMVGANLVVGDHPVHSVGA